MPSASSAGCWNRRYAEVEIEIYEPEPRVVVGAIYQPIDDLQIEARVFRG